VTYLFIIISVVLGAFAQLSLKYGTMKSVGIVSMYMNPYVILGLTFYGLSAITWIYSISKVQLSFAYPMVSLGYVIVFTLSYFLFGENLSFMRISGLLIIVVGVIVIARS
jgi:multidrug transporter EmrE-like cation transporter